MQIHSVLSYWGLDDDKMKKILIGKGREKRGLEKVGKKRMIVEKKMMLTLQQPSQKMRNEEMGM